MSSPLPVPSKAAITALRGLLVGTSCTLVLITEDRRRRINAARRVLDNADRLKSAKRYYAGGADFAIALEEDALLEQDAVTWSMRNGSGQHPNRSTGTLAMTLPAMAIPTAAAKQPILRNAEVSMKQAPELLREPDRARRLGAGSRIRLGSENKNQSNQSFAGRHTAISRSPTKNPRSTIAASSIVGGDALSSTSDASEFFANLRQLGETGDAQHVKQAVELFVTCSVKASELTPKAVAAMLSSSSLLCGMCVQLGQSYAAARVLQKAISSTVMEEDDYYRHNPFDVIDSILAPLGSEAVIGGVQAQDSVLDLAAELFMPRFASEVKVDDPRILAIGKRLLELAFARNDLKIVDTVFWKVMAQNPTAHEFMRWYMTRLHEAQAYGSVIKAFLNFYATTAPRDGAFYKTVGLVVDSVTAAYGHRVEQVLEFLLAEASKLKTAWVIKLLHAHWKRYGNLERMASIFRTLEDNLDHRVYYPDGVYRVMTEIALDAGDYQRATEYFADLTRRDAAFETDVRLLGLFALAKARNGDWEGVQSDFALMRSDTPSEQTARGEVFVPVLKEHIRQHSTGNTEEFLRQYIETEGVPVNRYMVGLMARQYGAKRDVKSFVQWLDYCAKSGFPLDASFTNALLTSCRTRWNFSFANLRKVFCTLRSLGGHLTNDRTERMLVQAAVSDVKASKARTVTAARSLATLDIPVSELHHVGRCAREENVLGAMAQAIKTGKPALAIRMYKRATRLGMGLGRGLRLAVTACVQMHGTANYRQALGLLQAAQRRGEDVTVAAMPLLDACMAQINLDAGKDKDVVLREVQAVLARFQQHKVQLNDYSLNRAALLCLRGGHFRGAISFGLAAGQASGQARACYNVFNFGVLLAAYAALLDSKAVMSAVSIALSSDYACDRLCLKALKVARRRLRRCTADTADVAEAREAVEKAIATVVERRKLMAAERAEVSKGVLRIMGEAVRDDQHRRNMEKEHQSHITELQQELDEQDNLSWRHLSLDTGDMGPEVHYRDLGRGLEYTQPLTAAG